MYELDVYDRISVLLWLIDGVGKHGLKISDASKISWDWIVENYNVAAHTCKHKVVSEIGYVQAFDEDSVDIGKHYDGFCDACEKTVHGFISFNGKVKRGWK